MPASLARKCYDNRLDLGLFRALERLTGTDRHALNCRKPEMRSRLRRNIGARLTIQFTVRRNKLKSELEMSAVKIVHNAIGLIKKYGRDFSIKNKSEAIFRPANDKVLHFFHLRKINNRSQ